MANEAKKIANLATTTTLSSTDRVVVLYNPASTANVLTITVNNFIKAIGNTLPGPYANDAAANTAGVGTKGMYYDSTGVVRVKIT